jgi:hypothetical protein
MPQWTDNQAWGIAPASGMTVTFTPVAEPDLAGREAAIVEVWPRCRSGDYLVTLQYAEPLLHGNDFVYQMEAFMSELVVLHMPQRAQTSTPPWYHVHWLQMLVRNLRRQLSIWCHRPMIEIN